MDKFKYFAGTSMIGIGIFLIASLSVGAMPYISIGDISNNFTVVPNQWADITLPIMIKNINASDPYGTIKGLVFNVTYNCSVINITNITQVDIVNVPNAPQMNIMYNRLCNGSIIDFVPLGFRKIICFFMNATHVVNNVNRTNASILVAVVRNTSQEDICVLKVVYASYKNLTTDTIIGKVKMKVSPIPNYFTTNITLPINITVESMGISKDVKINVSDATIHSKVKVDGLIKACRGDANKDGVINAIDTLFIAQHTAYMRNLDDIKDCLDVNGDGHLNAIDTLFVAQHTAYMRNINEY